MKKLVISLTCILIIVWVGLSIVSRGGEYPAEKLLYKALKGGQKIAANPEVIPPAAATVVENNLLALLKRYPASNVAIVAEIKLAEFYAFVKKYDESIEVLNRIIDRPNINMMVLSQAMFLKGNVYEKSNRWEKALTAYRALGKRCEESPLGLQAPLYIADYYARNAKTQAADEAYNDASIFYSRLAREKKGSPLGYWASEYLFKSYISLRKFQEAGEVLEGIFDAYPSNFTYMQNLPSIDPLFIKQLKNPGKAMDIYKKVLTKTTDKRIKEALTKKIERIGSDSDKVEVKVLES